MRLRKITLENFRSYFGRHELDLDTGTDGGLVILFGENMSGKTALFLALNWCLYGRAIGRRGESIPVYDVFRDDNNVLVNSRAADDEAWRMAVSLQWTHQEQEWRLDRSVRSSASADDGPSPEEVFLQIDDTQITRREIPQRVNQVLHRDAAQFYFFDGELLSQYERWLEDPHEKDRRVREAVEFTVGTAALRLHTEMEAIARETGEAQTSLVRKAQRGDRLTGQLQSARQRVSELEAEIVEYQEQVAIWKKQAKTIESRYGALLEFSGELARLSTIEQSISRNQERMKQTELELQSVVSDQYWIPLQSQNKELRAELESHVERLVSSDLGGTIHGILERSVLQGRCELCGHELDEFASKHIDSHGLGVQEESQLDDPIQILRESFDRLRMLEQYRAQGSYELVNTLENSRLDMRSEIHSDSQDAEALRRQHSDRPRGDVEAEIQRLIKINDDISSTEPRIDEAQAELEDQKAAAKKLQEQINRISIDLSIQRQAQAANIAASAMQGSLNAFCERARARVQEEASSVFQTLIADEDRGAIRIDEDYRIFPVDEEGEVMPIPSAGGQQLITLSLIGGLNRAAVHDAPMVMDTPAGRIDRGNRGRIIRWVGGLGQQTILMVHSGEYTVEEIARLGINVSKSYSITHDEFEGSRIRELP